MKCNDCGEKVNGLQSFCPNCGKTLKEDSINKDDEKDVSDLRKQFGAGNSNIKILRIKKMKKSLQYNLEQLPMQ